MRKRLMLVIASGGLLLAVACGSNDNGGVLPFPTDTASTTTTTAR